jgi:hypothetical protein
MGCRDKMKAGNLLESSMTFALLPELYVFQITIVELKEMVSVFLLNIARYKECAYERGREMSLCLLIHIVNFAVIK